MAGSSIRLHHGDEADLPILFSSFFAPSLLLILSPAADQGSLLLTVISAVSSFAATNIDDILLLVLLFSQATNRCSTFAVVGGQALGIGLLLLVSLSGLLGKAFLPRAWLGLLGLLPISLAVSRWLDIERSDADPLQADVPSAQAPPGEPTALAVAALTLANGGDNIGVYLPMFAHASVPQVLITLVVFAAMVLLWCFLAWRLAHAPGLGSLLHQHGPRLMPLVLIGLGITLLLEAHTFAHRGLAMVTLLCLAAMALPLARRPALPPLLALPATFPIPLPFRLPSP
jgi:cadmium resistance protein CadD (predicted permease)